jgi:hypothetical protein
MRFDQGYTFADFNKSKIVDVDRAMLMSVADAIPKTKGYELALWHERTSGLTTLIGLPDAYATI